MSDTDRLRDALTKIMFTAPITGRVHDLASDALRQLSPPVSDELEQALRLPIESIAYSLRRAGEHAEADLERGRVSLRTVDWSFLCRLIEVSAIAAERARAHRFVERPAPARDREHPEGGRTTSDDGGVW